MRDSACRSIRRRTDKFDACDPRSGLHIQEGLDPAPDMPGNKSKRRTAYFGRTHGAPRPRAERIGSLRRAAPIKRRCPRH
jgi:hypothetical protein